MRVPMICKSSKNEEKFILTLLAVLALSSAQPPILLPAAAAVLGGGLSPSSRNSSSAPAAAARDLSGLPNLKPDAYGVTSPALSYKARLLMERLSYPNKTVLSKNRSKKQIFLSF